MQAVLLNFTNLEDSISQQFPKFLISFLVLPLDYLEFLEKENKNKSQGTVSRDKFPSYTKVTKAQLLTDYSWIFNLLQH